MEMPIGLVVLHGAMDDMGEMAPISMATVGWSVEGATTFLEIWTVMLAAMMLPAAAPMVLVFAAVHAKRRGQPIFVPTWIFVAGYLLVWTAVGLAVYVLVQIGRDFAASLTSASPSTGAPIMLGSTLAMAGLYQLTPLKRVCLNHCHSPLGFVMEHWREGRVGALQMGIRHGGYCLGCCWALFAVLVAAGVMSLVWMLLLTLVIFAEKVFPHGRRVAMAVSIVSLVLGVLVATDAISMPWVTA